MSSFDRKAVTDKDALERRIDELCAELSTAQLNCDMWHDRAEDMRNRLSDAQNENAKLRELASILCFCMQVHAQCDDCKLNGAKGELAYDPLCACDGLHEILRELGIEADE